MHDIETRLRHCEIQREYAKRNYPSAFEEISRRIDLFISCLKEEQGNEDKSLSPQADRITCQAVLNQCLGQTVD